MSSETRFEFTKENIDGFLKELAKEYRKQVGKAMPAELILIGGASVLINYGFRNMTTDIDALIHASSAMKDAIRLVGDRHALPNDWLNADFRQTDSYSPKLAEFSVYYKTWSNILTVRTISAEYLVAMKLRSGRQYKSDLSDVIGILWEQEKSGDPLTMDRIKKAVEELYGTYDVLSPDVKMFIEQAIREGNYESLYAHIREAEAENKKILLEYQEEKPGVVNIDNANDIIAALRRRKEKK